MGGGVGVPSLMGEVSSVSFRVGVLCARPGARDSNCDLVTLIVSVLVFE